MTFKAYIASRRITDTPAGDFTQDAKRDRKLPNDFASWPALRRHLMARGVQSHAINAARQVWAGYRRAKRATGPVS